VVATLALDEHPGYAFQRQTVLACVDHVVQPWA
jgi:hypothetical protein